MPQISQKSAFFVSILDLGIIETITGMSMFRWIKKIAIGLPASYRPQEREDQSAWIKKVLREWQLRWHDFFDVDRDLADEGEFERPVPLPDEIDCDYRLIFGLKRATAQTRRACFEVFPSGKKMHKRFEDFLSSTPHALKEAEARARVTEVIALIEEIGPNEDVDFSKIKVVDRDTKEGMNALNNSDDVTILLERSAVSPHPVDDLEKVAARLFLTEPLYATAGNFYQVSNWVTAAMTGGTTDKLHFALYELWAGGWQVALGSDGLILASRRT